MLFNFFAKCIYYLANDGVNDDDFASRETIDYHSYNTSNYVQNTTLNLLDAEMMF